MERKETGFNPEKEIKKTIKTATAPLEFGLKYGVGYLAKRRGAAPCSSLPERVFYKITKHLGWTD